MESTGGDDPVVTVNGVGYAERMTSNTNFAVLVSTSFTEPFHEPIAYGKYLARLANLLSGGVLVQRLGDLMKGRRSTEERISRSLVRPSLLAATPGRPQLRAPVPLSDGYRRDAQGAGPPCAGGRLAPHAARTEWRSSSTRADLT